jgi:hypothetical protein
VEIPSEAPDAAAPPGRGDFPDEVAEARAERFLARVAALTPAEWGRLDAIAQRRSAGDLLTRLERVQRTARMAGGMWPKETRSREAVVWKRTMQLLAVTFTAVRELRDWVTLRERKPWQRPPRLSRSAAGSPQSRRMLSAMEEWSERLLDLAEAQPGGPGLAACSLYLALSAMLCGGPSTMQLLADFYAPVEPVIPFASLEAA